LPLSQASAPPKRSPLSLQFLQWEKGAHRGYQDKLVALGSLCESPYSNLTPHILQGNLQGSKPGNLTIMEKEGETCKNQYIDPGRPSSYLQYPSSPKQKFCSSVQPY